MNKIKLSCLCLACALSLTGCIGGGSGGSSDSLGIVKEGQEALKTYGEVFAPARNTLKSGKFDSLVADINAPFIKDGKGMSDEDIKEKLVDDNSELSIAERGLLTLNCGDIERALVYFDAADQKMEKVEEGGFFSKAASFGKTGLAAASGLEEVGDYKLRGYEKVMVLNYKALCYLLMGDRKAYNVTRRAIERQQKEWESFQERKAKFDAKEKNAEVEKIVNAIPDKRSSAAKKKASLVSSAYVNPFGDYMDAVMNELDSLDTTVKDTSLRDNARIAYEKVVKNNAKCATAKTAAKQVVKTAPAGKKIVHVILADGFAPEKKEHSEAIAVGKYAAAVNFAVATPIASPVNSARVKAAGQTSSMHSLSQIESIVLRDEQDNMPWRYAMMALGIIRSGAAGALSEKAGLGSVLGAGAASKLQRPDTRSWLSLPNQVLVARMYVPANTKQITLETLSQGKVRATTSVNIAAHGPTVVYAVSYDKQLRAYANKKSWVSAK